MILVLSLQKTSGARRLENVVLFHSLQRGPVQRSERNPCSTVPGRSKGRCTVGEIHVHAQPQPHAPPFFSNSEAER